MRQVARPNFGGGVIEIGPPMTGPNAVEPEEDKIIGEESLDEVPDGISKLLGQFYQEIDLADYARQPKEGRWMKIEKYLAGKDSMDAPKEYNESKFFYRRLPRITQIAKAKLYKHVCPIQGRPWEVKLSPRHDQDMDQMESDHRISRLREEICDIDEAIEAENLADDICQYMADLGTAVLYGPVQLSNPRIRWQDGAEVLDESDKLKPMWKPYDPRYVYPDSNAKRWEDLEFVHFYHTLSQHQIRTLEEDPTFMADELASLIDEMPDGNWSGNMRRWEYSPWPANYANSALRRYSVWMRIGFLTAEGIEALGEKVPDTEEYAQLKNFKKLSKAERRTMVESQWEIWFCAKHVIKISKRKFQPKRMPVYFIPFRRDPNSIFGIGAGEAALEVTDMLVNICRSIDDALDDTSGFQMIIDASRIENKDLKVQGRKTWIWRNKSGNMGGGGGANNQGKPIEMFTVPSNLPHLLECYKLFESMLPIVSGVPEMVVGKDLGSGVRTDSMMSDMWESLEEFLRDVVGNIDRYYFKPKLRDTYNWIQAYYPNWEEFKVEADLQVQGVRGALRREIVGRKVKEVYTELHQFGLPDWFDEIELAKAIMEGIGIEQEKALLTPKQYVEKQQLKLQRQEMEAAAGRRPEDQAKEKERAHASTRDTMMEAYKSTISQDPTNPVLVPLLERIFKLTGELDPKASMALSIMARKMAKQMEEEGVANEQEANVLATPPKADNPLELAPGARNNEQAKAASLAGPGPKTPPNPLPAQPTTQQLPGVNQ
jgi:hypothetical protein